MIHDDGLLSWCEEHCDHASIWYALAAAQIETAYARPACASRCNITTSRMLLGAYSTSTVGHIARVVNSKRKAKRTPDDIDEDAPKTA